MLRKLMKHELRATARMMGPMLLLTLAAAVGGNVSVHNLLETNNDTLNFLGFLLLSVFLLVLIAAFFASFVLMIERFYKSLLRDEGYLMMTLPVTVHEHILSKLFVSLFWFAVTAVVMVLSMGILVFELEIVEGIIQAVGEVFAKLEWHDLRVLNYAGHFLFFCIELILLLIVAGSGLCLQPYAAMAVGHSFTHHKGLMSVAAWFVFSVAWNILQNAGGYLLNLMDLEGIRLWEQGLHPTSQVHMMMLGATALLLIPCALWYAITTHFLKNRLNIG